MTQEATAGAWRRPSWDEYFLQLARQAATRSTCLRRQVGAVLVRPRLMMGLGLRVWSGWQAFQRVRPIARTLWRQLL